MRLTLTSTEQHMLLMLQSKDKNGGGSAELLPWTCWGQTLAYVGDWFTKYLGRQYWRAKKSRKAGHSSCRKSWKVVPVVDRIKSSLYIKRWVGGEKQQPGQAKSFAGGQEKMSRGFSLPFGRRELRRTTWLFWGFKEKIRRAEVQLELNLSTAVKDNKNISINTAPTKRRLRRISILYWMQGETQWQR